MFDPVWGIHCYLLSEITPREPLEESMGEEGVEVDRTFVTPPWDFRVVSSGHDNCLYGARGAKKTKKAVLGTPNMWEPKLPLALFSARSNFGSHMLVVPRTIFLAFWAHSKHPHRSRS